MAVKQITKKGIVARPVGVGGQTNVLEYTPVAGRSITVNWEKTVSDTGTVVFTAGTAETKSYKYGDFVYDGDKTITGTGNGVIGGDITYYRECNSYGFKDDKSKVAVQSFIDFGNGYIFRDTALISSASTTIGPLEYSWTATEDCCIEAIWFSTTGSVGRCGILLIDDVEVTNMYSDEKDAPWSTWLPLKKGQTITFRATVSRLNVNFTAWGLF